MSRGTAVNRSGSLVLVTGETWPQSCRLALAAREAGFTVHVVAPRRHPIAQLKWVHMLGHYSHLGASRSVSRALNSLPFDIVVAIDDFAASAVFEAYLTGRLNPTTASAVRRSFGDPSTFASRSTRATVAEIVASAGVRAPRTWAVPDEDSVARILEIAGLPAVLKSEGSSSGNGVIVVEDEAGARAAYRALSRARLTPDSLAWMLPRYDGCRPSRSILWRRPGVTLQEFVHGQPATITALARDGEVVGSLGFRVLNTRLPLGPATVVEPVQHPDMERAAETLARRLGLSGLFGLDFILSPDRATASLLELNPRAVPTAHLSLPWQSRPLFHVLADSLGLESPPPPPPLSADAIALFPQAWRSGSGCEHVLHRDADVPHAEDVAKVCESALAPRGLRVKVAGRIMRSGLKRPVQRVCATSISPVTPDVSGLGEPDSRRFPVLVPAQASGPPDP